MSLRDRLKTLYRAPDKRLLLRRVVASAAPRLGFAPTLEDSLDLTWRWLRRAHDATPDDGVSAMFSLAVGWTASYPETTGYLIPTLLAYARSEEQPEALERALRMARWECDVQLPDGAVRSGWMSDPPAPAVFNTGQVLFGWLAAAREAEREGEAADAARFRDSAARAARWLVEHQDEDGAWRRNLSASATSPVQAYNVRAAWGLGLAGEALGERAWVEAAERSARWTLSRQDRDGWFADMEFLPGEPPPLHTIAYVLEGLVGLGQLLKDERFVLSAGRAATPLAEALELGVTPAGAYDAGFAPAVRWRCLTGEAQLSLVLGRLARHTRRHAAWRALARKLLEGLVRLQPRSGEDVKGALAGSEPIWGAYCGFSYPNHAAKFLLDALLLELRDLDVQARG